jgi:hypothetical protein
MRRYVNQLAVQSNTKSAAFSGHAARGVFSAINEHEISDEKPRQ